MLGRFLLGAVTATAVIVPALAGTMSAEEARRFVAGKMFAFTCFDGTRGTGRILDDLGADGTVQFNGSGPMRHIRLPGNTLLVRGQTVCASLKGMPFEPCFYLDKRDDRSFRGTIQGMAFAYCDFRHMGGSRMLMARASSRSRGARRAPVVGSQELTMRMSGRGHAPKPEAGRSENIGEIRRSTE